MFAIPMICGAIGAVLYQAMWTLDDRKKNEQPTTTDDSTKEASSL